MDQVVMRRFSRGNFLGGLCVILILARLIFSQVPLRLTSTDHGLSMSRVSIHQTGHGYVAEILSVMPYTSHFLDLLSRLPDQSSEPFMHIDTGIYTHTT